MFPSSAAARHRMPSSPEPAASSALASSCYVRTSSDASRNWGPEAAVKVLVSARRRRRGRVCGAGSCLRTLYGADARAARRRIDRVRLPASASGGIVGLVHLVDHDAFAVQVASTPHHRSRRTPRRGSAGLLASPALRWVGGPLHEFTDRHRGLVQRVGFIDGYEICASLAPFVLVIALFPLQGAGSPNEHGPGLRLVSLFLDASVRKPACSTPAQQP